MPELRPESSVANRACPVVEEKRRPAPGAQHERGVVLAGVQLLERLLEQERIADETLRGKMVELAIGSARGQTTRSTRRSR
jgi:hypothetical protein